MGHGPGGQTGSRQDPFAIAIAYRAIQNGFDAFFTTAATLIDYLSAAFRAGEITNALPTYTHPAVLVIDDLGTRKLPHTAAEDLLELIMRRYERALTLDGSRRGPS